MLLIVKQFGTDNILFEHELNTFSLSGDYLNAFMTGGFVEVPFSVGNLVSVSIDNQVDLSALYDSYQFAMSTYVDEEGVTRTGITNNSLVFHKINI